MSICNYNQVQKCKVR
uniref:Uncharacterized protein n=1 Tax=Arundo donax TaxID=35708 RepID=A0A0A9H3N7_ARUDO